MSIFDRLFSRLPDEGGPATGEVVAPTAFVPRYPPVDDGLPLVEPEELLRSQQDLLHRIQITSGATGDAFAQLYIEPMLSLAAFVQLLPASRDYHHRGAGGAFRFGLETAFYALQASEGAIFTGYDSIQRRRELEPKWRYATFLAGLCVDLHVPLTDLLVVDAGGKHTWSPFEQSLHAFCRSHHLKRYFVRWQPVIGTASDTDQRARASVAAFVVNQVIPNISVRHIGAGSPRILAAMMAAITGQVRPSDHNMLHQLVAQARNDMINRDRKAQPDHYGRVQIGSQIEPHVIDAMRRLVKAGGWTVNLPDGDVFCSAEGAFVRWPRAAAALSSQLALDGTPGVPRDEDLLASLLIDAGIAQPFADADGRLLHYWQIFHAGETLSALRLASPDILFPRDLPPPAEFEVLSPVELVDQVTQQMMQGSGGQEAPPERPAETPPAAVIEAPPAGPAPVDTPAWVQALTQMGLDEPVRLLLQAIGEFVRETGADDQVRWTEAGLAISIPLIKDFGFEEDRIIQGLTRSNWLHVDPARPGRIKHPVMFGEQRVSCILLQEKLGQLIKEQAS